MSMDAQARSEQVSDPVGPDGLLCRPADLTTASRISPIPRSTRLLPAGWLLGPRDIVRSTAAIQAGRYKDVNTAAASVIAAFANALEEQAIFPSCSAATARASLCRPQLRSLAAGALADVAAWVRDEFDLELRVAMVSVDELRARGFDVRMARFAPSPNVSYAMFTGGGLAYAERQMKAGEFGIGRRRRADPYPIFTDCPAVSKRSAPRTG